MTTTMHEVNPCLRFDGQAEEAMLGMQKLDIAALERAADTG